MAALISRATGALTAASFAAIATGTGASVLTNNNTVASTTTATSETFTITNGEIVDAILLMLHRGTATAGTMTLSLRKNSVIQQSVTINCTDLPASKSWVLFKLPATVTGAGTSDYDLHYTFSGQSGSINRYYLTSTTAWTRALRTTTTATPNAADDLYIVGELTTNTSGTPFTGNVTNGLNSIANVSSFSGLSVGMVLSASSSFSSVVTITALDPGNSLVHVNANATATTNGVTFTPQIGTGSDITITMDQIEGNTSVYERTFTGDMSAGVASITTPSSIAGLAIGNQVTGGTITATQPPVISSFNSATISLTTVVATTFSAGTGSSFTAKTGYGAIHIGKRGILEFGTTASTNYLLRMFGDLNVWGDGVLNIGKLGSELLTNGSFDSGLTGWTNNSAGTGSASATGGRATLTNGAGTDWGIIWQTIATTVGATYRIRVVHSGADLYVGAYQPGIILDERVEAGVNELTFVAENSTTDFEFLPYDPSTSCVVESISVMEVQAIPRSSTAVLELGPASDGGYGLIANDGATVSMQGLSRTSGKNVDRCKVQGGAGLTFSSGFTSSFTSGSAVITGVPANAFACGLTIGDHIQESAGGTAVIPAGTTIVSFDAGAGTITMSQNAASTNGAHPFVTNASSGSKLITVDTDTGWLSGDHIAIASTSRTASHCEVGKLTANATANRLASDGFVLAATGQVLPLTGTAALTWGHDGFSPVQAEVILLTRNVKVRSISPTLVTYVFLAGLATCDFDWVEFYYLGDNATNKRGIEIQAAASASPKNIQFCSIHDCEDMGFAFATGTTTSLNMTISNNVMWNCGSVTGPAINFLTGITNNDWTLHNNVVMRTLSGNCITLSDIGGTFTDNTAIGAASIGIQFNEQSAVFGTFSGNIAHSNASAGYAFQTGQSGVVSDLTAWRNNSSGISMASAAGLHFDGGVLFGNNTQNIAAATAGGEVRFSDYTFNSDSSFQTLYGVFFQNSGAAGLYLFDNCDFSTASGIKTAHGTSDINIGALSAPEIILRDCIIAGPTEVQNQANLSPLGYVASARHDQTAGNHKVWKRAGTIQSDSTLYRTASPSERLTPASTLATTGQAPALISGTVGSGVSVIPIIGSIEKAAVGQFVYISASHMGIITAVDTVGMTVTLDRTVLAASSGTQFFIQPKLESGSKLIPLNSGASKAVAVFVRKQQENQITYSEDFSQSGSWSLANITLGTTSSSPSGGTLTRLVETAATNVHGLNRNTTISVATGGTYTFSVEAKADQRSWIVLRSFGNATSRYAWFDLTNGVVGTVQSGLTASITALGSGVYRCSITFSALGALENPGVYLTTADNNIASYLGSTSNGAHVGALQLEAGSTPSPYQVTTSAKIDGYNGSQPRLICKANRQLGLEEDLVLGTFGGGLGAWGMISGTTPVAADNGAFELVVDCDGTTGFVNVDDWRMAA